jgi:predicted ATPase
MKVRRIAVTGGPGAGKTTLWRELAAALPDRVVAVPEVATALLTHVFPPVQDREQRCALQRAIFAVQSNLERAYEARLGADQLLLCDRGVPDGAGYWPDGAPAFFAAQQCDATAELQRYEAVLFLESAAVGGYDIAANNPTRSEEHAAAVQVDQRLRAVWAGHPKLLFIACEPDFARKLERAKALFASLLR